MPITPSTTITAFASLALVVGAVLLAAYLARRTGFARTGGAARLALSATLALDRTKALHLVTCDGRDLLILASPTGTVPVGWLPALPSDAPLSGVGP